MKRILVLLALMFTLGTSTQTMAQCSMCRRVAESNMENGETKGRGLNTGILYLMSLPYLMGGVAGFIWWKHRKKA
jgi:predicted metal-binding protein